VYRCHRYRNKPYKVFSAGVEAAFFWSSLFLCLAIIAFGPITGVVAAGLIFGQYSQSSPPMQFQRNCRCLLLSLCINPSEESPGRKLLHMDNFPSSPRLGLARMFAIRIEGEAGARE